MKKSSTVTSLGEYLGVEPDSIPPITQFVAPSAEPARLGAASQTAGQPAWVNSLLHITQGVARRSGMAIVLAELSVLADVLTDPLSVGRPYFTTNIVCPAEPNTSAPVLTAYLSAISNISREGTTINIADFHRLHAVHVSVSRQGPRSFEDASPNLISHHRSNVPVTALNRKYRKRRNVIDFEEHHSDFFVHFLDMWSAAGEQTAEVRLHYLALPFQRPGHAPLPGKASPTALEPAGAMYLILQPEAADEYEEQCERRISDIASRLQYICTHSCLSASSLIADSTASLAGAQEAMLRAYDGIGHALRTFVEATGYEGAVKLLAAVQFDPRMPKELADRVARAQMSITFFKHVDALGSLMRLHGWLAEPSGMGKVLDCFDGGQVREILSGGVHEDFFAAAAASVIRPLASALAYKDEVVFRMRHRRDESHEVETQLVDGNESLPARVQEEPTFPPLRTDGDRKAVLLALNVALLEPLRNAAMHVRKRTPASTVEVVIEGRARGAVRVYIGNRWYNEGQPPTDLVSLSTGVNLVNALLRNCRLGGFFIVNMADIGSTDAPVAPDQDYDGYVWVGIEIDPLALYKFARSGVGTL